MILTLDYASRYVIIFIYYAIDYAWWYAAAAIDAVIYFLIYFSFLVFLFHSHFRLPPIFSFWLLHFLHIIDVYCRWWFSPATPYAITIWCHYCHYYSLYYIAEGWHAIIILSLLRLYIIDYLFDDEIRHYAIAIDWDAITIITPFLLPPFITCFITLSPILIFLMDAAASSLVSIFITLSFFWWHYIFAIITPFLSIIIIISCFRWYCQLMDDIAIIDAYWWLHYATLLPFIRFIFFAICYCFIYFIYAHFLSPYCRSRHFMLILRLIFSLPLIFSPCHYADYSFIFIDSRHYCCALPIFLSHYFYIFLSPLFSFISLRCCHYCFSLFSRLRHFFRCHDFHITLIDTLLIISLFIAFATLIILPSSLIDLLCLDYFLFRWHLFDYLITLSWAISDYDYHALITAAFNITPFTMIAIADITCCYWLLYLFIYHTLYVICFISVILLYWHCYFAIIFAFDDVIIAITLISLILRLHDFFADIDCFIDWLLFFYWLFIDYFIDITLYLHDYLFLLLLHYYWYLLHWCWYLHYFHLLIAIDYFR